MTTLLISALLSLTLQLEVPQQYYNSVSQNEDICCLFEVTSNPNLTHCIIKDKSTGVQLGVIYGYPSIEMLNMLVKEVLTEEHIVDLVR